MTTPTDRPDTGLPEAAQRVKEAFVARGWYPWPGLMNAVARAARADYPDVEATVQENDRRWRALVNGIAIGARATGNYDRERAALDILAIDERLP